MISNSEMSRVRRQMRQRIRDVVAERRLARETDVHPGESTDQAQMSVDSQLGEGSMVGG